MLNLAGGPIMLSGRIDRLDENGEQKAIVDYKTKVRVTGEKFAVVKNRNCRYTRPSGAIMRRT